MVQRIWASKLYIRKDHEKHLLAVATRIVHLHGELGISSELPDMESLMSMDLKGLFRLCDLDLQPHYMNTSDEPDAFMTYMEYDELPLGFEGLIKELAPLLRAGSRFVTYDGDDEDRKAEYVLSRGQVWLWRNRYKVVFTGEGKPL